MAHDNQISCISHLKFLLNPSARDLAFWRQIKRWQEPHYNCLVLRREEQEGWFPLLLPGMTWGSSLEEFVICFSGFLKWLIGMLRGKESNVKTGGVLWRGLSFHSSPVWRSSIRYASSFCWFIILSRNIFSDPGMNTLFLSDMLKTLRKCTSSTFDLDAYHDPKPQNNCFHFSLF